MLKQKHSIRRCFALLTAFALLLTLLPTASAKPTRGQKIRYIPTEVNIEEDCIKIKGYFVNLNSRSRVMNFTDFSMGLYYDGDRVTYGDFGDLPEFTIEPLSAYRFTFTINGSHSWKVGDYDCDNRWYATLSFSFHYITV